MPREGCGGVSAAHTSLHHSTRGRGRAQHKAAVASPPEKALERTGSHRYATVDERPSARPTMARSTADPSHSRPLVLPGPRDGLGTTSPQMRPKPECDGHAGSKRVATNLEPRLFMHIDRRNGAFLPEHPAATIPCNWGYLRGERGFATGDIIVFSQLIVPHIFGYDDSTPNAATRRTSGGRGKQPGDQVTRRGTRPRQRVTRRCLRDNHEPVQCPLTTTCPTMRHIVGHPPDQSH